MQTASSTPLSRLALALHGLSRQLGIVAGTLNNIAIGRRVETPTPPAADEADRAVASLVIEARDAWARLGADLIEAEQLVLRRLAAKTAPHDRSGFDARGAYVEARRMADEIAQPVFVALGRDPYSASHGEAWLLVAASALPTFASRLSARAGAHYIKAFRPGGGELPGEPFTALIREAHNA
jgi:hypothetical protein